MSGPGAPELFADELPNQIDGENGRSSDNRMHVSVMNHIRHAFFAGTLRGRSRFVTARIGRDT